MASDTADAIWPLRSPEADSTREQLVEIPRATTPTRGTAVKSPRLEWVEEPRSPYISAFWKRAGELRTNDSGGVE